jgi:hypothetical protein
LGWVCYFDAKANQAYAQLNYIIARNSKGTPFKAILDPYNQKPTHLPDILKVPLQERATSSKILTNAARHTSLAANEEIITA